jgi:hypothetical protein
VKKRPRAKSAPRSKPERKPKGAKGPPKSKRGSKGKAPEKKPAIHPEPTEHAGPGKLDQMYGGFTLRLYDHDKKGAPPAVYEGKLRDVIFSCEKPIPVPAATSSGAGPAAGSCTVTDGDTQLIAKLQRDLWSLGFWVFPREIKGDVVQPVVSGVFDWRTEWAVREFQIAAAMPNVAVQDVKKEPTAAECKSTGKYLATLSAAKNDKLFTEHPSGVVTPKTVEFIKHWQDKHYRCPVVIQAFRMKDDPSSPGKGKKAKSKHPKRVRDVVHTENIWRHDEVPNPTIKMFAWDFSGYFQLGDNSAKEIAVGSFTWDRNKNFCGPIADRRDAWPEAQLTPKSWRGKEWPAMTKEEKSTWRAIMAVANRECSGALDVVNFWDNCLGSAGHYHWTMPMSTGGGGEFCGFMALLEAKYPDAFKHCFASFGLWGPRWVGSTPDGERKPLPEGVTFHGYVYTKGTDGKFIQQPAKEEFAEATWLRSWHAAYRLEMAARTCAEYRRAMWDYARMRIVGIRKMSQVNAWLPDACRTAGAKVTLGDVFTSEQGMAFVLRLHVWRPASFISDKRELVKKKNKKTGKVVEKWEGLPILHDTLKKLFAAGTLKEGDGTPIKDDEDEPVKWEIPLPRWTEDHERILIDTMLDLAGEYTKKSAKSSLQLARYWPLKLSSNSLELEEKHSDDDKKKGKKEGPMLHVRGSSPGLPSPPKREGNIEVIEADLQEFQPSESRGSFRLAE